jgi:hypothetical protein
MLLAFLGEDPADPLYPWMRLTNTLYPLAVIPLMWMLHGILSPGQETLSGRVLLVGSLAVTAGLIRAVLTYWLYLVPGAGLQADILNAWAGLLGVWMILLGYLIYRSPTVPRAKGRSSVMWGLAVALAPWANIFLAAIGFVSERTMHFIAPFLLALWFLAVFGFLGWAWGMGSMLRNPRVNRHWRQW